LGTPTWAGWRAVWLPPGRRCGNRCRHHVVGCRLIGRHGAASVAVVWIEITVGWVRSRTYLRLVSTRAHLPGCVLAPAHFVGCPGEGSRSAGLNAVAGAHGGQHRVFCFLKIADSSGGQFPAAGCRDSDWRHDAAATVDPLVTADCCRAGTGLSRRAQSASPVGLWLALRFGRAMAVLPCPMNWHGRLEGAQNHRLEQGSHLLGVNLSHAAARKAGGSAGVRLRLRSLWCGPLFPLLC